MKKILYLIISATMLSECNNPRPNDAAGRASPKESPSKDSLSANLPTTNPSPALKGDEPGSFGYDLNFLQKHDKVVVLKSGDAQVIVSPKYQAKVFTSTANGLSGASFGWIHYKAFDGAPDTHMNAYGGENRLWLGPEGGKFSLFFKSGAKMEIANWKTPAAFDTEPWQLKDKNETSVILQKDMHLVNYAGTKLDLSINREIKILDRDMINRLFQLEPDASIKVVGYQTINLLKNTGKQAWTETSGMPCIWMLDMFNPGDHTTVIIPYKKDGNPKPATTDYFGEIAADRIKLADGILYFKADGKSRGKLGIHPSAANPVAGSYDADKKILTITLFEVNERTKYLNQEWNTTKPPFSGDAVNAYNDGPLASGTQMGPFYELESVSPAALLPAGESMTHHHSVFHFTGNEKSLDAISKKILGVGLGL